MLLIESTLLAECLPFCAPKRATTDKEVVSTYLGDFPGLVEADTFVRKKNKEQEADPPHKKNTQVDVD